MTETKQKLEYNIISEIEAVPAIIVAAGSSNRMQGINKQFLELGGIPVIVRTLLKFQKSSVISRIILVTRAEDIFALQKLANEHNITKLSDIVCGGNSRQESVLNGFARLGKDESRVLIHDGARPFVSDSIITAVAEKLGEYSAVTCAVKVKDTVKQVDENGKVIKTLERDSLVSVQTPQGVNKSQYLSAVEKAGDVSCFTDDMSVMEYGGYEVYTINGSYKNIKITTPEDIFIAESFLEEDV